VKTQNSSTKKEVHVPVEWCDPETFVVTIRRRACGSFARRLQEDWQAVLERHFDGLCLNGWPNGPEADFVGESEGRLELETKRSGGARVMALPCFPIANTDNE
jgi:hypothetical protein